MIVYVDNLLHALAAHAKIRDMSLEGFQNGSEPENVFAFLDKTKFAELRKSNESFEAWLQTLSFIKYKEYLTRLNGLIRRTPIRYRSTDEEAVYISLSEYGDVAYLPPAEEQKDHLMQRAFFALRCLKDNDDRALLAFYSMQAIHPFSDGNGRTGRVLYNIFSREGGGLAADMLQRSLETDHKGREDFSRHLLEPQKAYYFFNREVAKDIFGKEFTEKYAGIYVAAASGIGHVPQSVDLSPGDRNLLEMILGEDDVPEFPFRALVIASFLLEENQLKDFQFDLTRKFSSKSVPEDDGKEILGIEGEKFMGQLSTADALRLIAIHKSIKAKFVEKIIDVVRAPCRHQIATKSGDLVPILSLLRV